MASKSVINLQPFPIFIKVTGGETVAMRPPVPAAPEPEAIAEGLCGAQARAGQAAPYGGRPAFDFTAETQGAAPFMNGIRRRYTHW
jgi:hypothetical protein